MTAHIAKTQISTFKCLTKSPFSPPPMQEEEQQQKKKGKKKEARPGTFRNPAGLWVEKKAATYSPTVRSTIGAAGLNCSVRDGKRWNPRAMAASMTDKPRQRQNNKKGKRQRGIPTKKGNQGRFGRLVMLGCDVAIYTPASYLRHRL